MQTHAALITLLHTGHTSESTAPPSPPSPSPPASRLILLRVEPSSKSSQDDSPNKLAMHRSDIDLLLNASPSAPSMINWPRDVLPSHLLLSANPYTSKLSRFGKLGKLGRTTNRNSSPFRCSEKFVRRDSRGRRELCGSWRNWMLHQRQHEHLRMSADQPSPLRGKVGGAFRVAGGASWNIERIVACRPLPCRPSLE